MKKFIRNAILILMGFITLSGIGLYFSRNLILEALITQQFHTRNVPLQSLTIRNISLQGVSLHNLILGTNNELSIDEINLTWSLSHLLRGMLNMVEIKGITLWLALDGTEPLFGSLQPIIDSPGESSTSNIVLPGISQLSISLNINSTKGNVFITLNGSIREPSAQTQSGDLQFAVESFAGNINGQAKFTIEARETIRGNLLIVNGGIDRRELSVTRMNGKAAFILSALQPYHVDAELNLFEITLPDETELISPRFKQATLNLQLNQHCAQLDGQLLASDNNEAAQLQMKVAHATPNLVVSLNAAGLAKYYPWRWLAMEQPSSGAFSLKLHGTGQIPSQISKSSNPSWLERIQFEGNAQLDLNTFSYEKKLSNLDAKLDFKIAIAKGIGHVNLTSDSVIQFDSADSVWLAQSGLPLALSKDIAKGGALRFDSAKRNRLSQISWSLQSNHIDITTQFFASLRFAQARANLMGSGQVELKANRSHATQPTFALKDLTLKVFDVNVPGLKIERAMLSGTAHGTFDSWNGNFMLSTKMDRIDLGSLTAHKMLIDIPIRVSAQGVGWNIALTEQSQVLFALSDNTKQLTIKQPLRLTISQLGFDVKQHIDDFSIKHQVSATLTPFSVWLTPQTAPIEVHINPGKFVFNGQFDKGQPYQAEGKWTGATVFLTQSQIKLEDIAASISLGAKKYPLAQLMIGKLYHLADTPFFAPHSFSATVNDKIKGKQHTYTLDVVGGLTNLKYFQLKAEQNLINGLGNLKFNLIPTNFTPGGTQLSDLLPTLGQTMDIQGVVHAHAQVDWSKKGVQESSGVIVVDNLSFTHPTLKIEGLNTRINFDKLSPISTLPQQVIHIQTIDPGIPLDNLNIVYQIESNQNSESQIKLKDAKLAIWDGALAVEPVTIDPLSGDAKITLTLNDINLKRFFNSIEIDGLEGEGRLDGRIPIRLHDHRITIDDGRLMAKSPGILRFQSEKASQMLANAGAEMNFVLDALQDFHYSELSLTINKSAAHDLTVTLSLLGQNPGIKEGKMIRLNINLTSNLDKILKAISLGYDVSNKILKDLFR
ncbi:MAG: YdbH domain-containing protein [Nitrosomonas sp.]|nr:YdbH domain-containing protein [Nitrosomonas sp.]